MEDRVERAARAYYEKDFESIPTAIPWERLQAKTRKRFCAAMRAALAAADALTEDQTPVD